LPELMTCLYLYVNPLPNHYLNYTTAIAPYIYEDIFVYKWDGGKRGGNETRFLNEGI
jgi:hypothetical protein